MNGQGRAFFITRPFSESNSSIPAHLLGRDGDIKTRGKHMLGDDAFGMHCALKVPKSRQIAGMIAEDLK